MIRNRERKGGFADGGESGFLGAIAAEESKGPLFHAAAVVEPVVGPGIEGGTREPCVTTEMEGFWKEFGLGFFGVAGSIETEFGEKDRAVAGEMVKAGQVAFEGFVVFEIDIEGGKIGGGRLEIFGGGEVGVSDREPWGGVLGITNEAIECPVDLPGGHPTGHVGGDFISDKNSTETRVVAVLSEPVDEILSGVFEERGVFTNEVAAVSPGVGRDDDEIVFGRGIEEGFVRQGVDADGIESGPADLWEINFGRMAAPRGEGAVGDGAQEVRTSIEMEVLSVHGEPHGWSLPEGREGSSMEFGNGQTPKLVNEALHAMLLNHRRPGEQRGDSFPLTL